MSYYNLFGIIYRSQYINISKEKKGGVAYKKTHRYICMQDSNGQEREKYIFDIE